MPTTLNPIQPPTAVFFPLGFDYRTWLHNRNLPAPDAFHGPILCFACNEQYPNWTASLTDFPAQIFAADLKIPTTNH